MIDHVSLKVSDFEKAKEFYKAALAPLGYQLMMEFPGHAGFGAEAPDFWLTASDQPINPAHVAFSAGRPTVDAFYEAALAAGAKDNGAPGLRPQYHPDYYGAFVLDPDGNNVEACCHLPEGAVKKAARKPAKKPAAKKPAAKKPAAKKPAAKEAGQEAHQAVAFQRMFRRDS